MAQCTSIWCTSIWCASVSPGSTTKPVASPSVERSYKCTTPCSNRRPKTRASERTIALDTTTVAALRSWRTCQLHECLASGEAWRDEGWVFTNELGGFVHPDTLRQHFARARRRADLPAIPFHGHRHSHATAALAAGVPAKVVQERLGHSSIAVTLDRYAHVMPRRDEDAAARVAAMFDNTTGATS